MLRVLRDKYQQVKVARPIPDKYLPSRHLRRLSAYLADFYVPVLAIFQKNSYNIVISWQMRLGICYGILKRLFHVGRPPIHVIQDFHINLTRNDRPYRLKTALMRLAIPGIDYFFCTSREEEGIYSRMFGIEPSRIVFLPLTEAPQGFSENNYPPGDYIFSYGKSDRDFDTLLRAVAPLDKKTYILCPNYRPKEAMPENVVIISNHLPQGELDRWIGSSRLVVIPLVDYRIAAGQISMLEVMARGRPLIITENMATKEYGRHGETALFFKAGDSQGLAEHICYLWNNRDAAEFMARKAREEARHFYDRHLNVFNETLKRCALDLQRGEEK